MASVTVKFFNESKGFGFITRRIGGKDLFVHVSGLSGHFPDAWISIRMSDKKDGAAISDNGNLLLDVYFTQLPALDELNVLVKMIPGVVEHSLFYRMATKAIVAGAEGIKAITPTR